MHPLCHARRHLVKLRRGATATELVVAATLLVSAIGTVMPLALSAGRIRRDASHYQLALEELSNQLDRLCSLDAKQRDAAIAKLALSEDLRDALPDATLDGEIIGDRDGTRLVLTLDWKRRAGAAPIRLAGWLDALPAGATKTSSKPAEETSQ